MLFDLESIGIEKPPTLDTSLGKSSLGDGNTLDIYSGSEYDLDFESDWDLDDNLGLFDDMVFRMKPNGAMGQQIYPEILFDILEVGLPQLQALTCPLRYLQSQGIMVGK